MTVTTPHTVAEGRQGSGTSQEFLNANGQSFVRLHTPKNENGVKKTLFIRSMCVTGCVTPTTSHKQHASALATVPSLPGVPAMNKLQQDSQCA
jgi:hypothetical protein